MNLATLSSADFVKIARLLKAKDALLSKIADLDAELSSFGTGAPTGARRGRPRKSAAAGPKPGRAKRGALKESIVALLKEAGPTGLSVKEIAAKTGVKGANIHAWFFTTGKKITEIKKVGKSTHAWVA
jgi:hypothetical protein